jgi:anti-sigma regulatory factor (Ser/Thr protein kinase)
VLEESGEANESSLPERRGRESQPAIGMLEGVATYPYCYDPNVRFHLPNSAFLGNIETFVSKVDPSGSGNLRVTFNPRWVYVHPAVLAMVACAGTLVRAQGGTVKATVPRMRTLPYLIRMKLFDHLGIDPKYEIQEHEAAGRFIPLTQIRTNDELSQFIVDMIPLLHAEPEEVGPIKYVMSELVRNVLEHALSSVGALVCAQYFSDSGRLAVGVADAGVGILGSMAKFHPVKTSLEATTLALRPGITGTTSRWGGTEYNAGAGLFFVKAIACASRNFFMAYSGDGLFKLRRTPADQEPVIQTDPADDRATRHDDVPPWQGTVMGIDLTLSGGVTFERLLREIRDVYHLDVREGRKAVYKKPRFA